MASWSFNPFTGNLDLVGSGGGSTVFEGEVATFADLPVTIGDPAVGAAYLVRESTGVWLVNRRQAGIYIRRNNTGVAATDWEYGGDYPVNSVNNQTGNVVLGKSDVGLGNVDNTSDANKPVSTATQTALNGKANTSHTHAAADIASGTFDNDRINFAAPAAIGSTTRNTGAFTTLTANNGTLTASAPVLDLAQTWNNAAVAFTGLRFNATNTASSTSSKLLDFQIGGTSVVETSVLGHTTFRRLSSTISYANMIEARRVSTLLFGVRDDGSITGESFYVNAAGAGHVGFDSNGYGMRSSARIGWSSDGAAFSLDTAIFRDSAGVLGQRFGSTAQGYNIYNTYTSSTNFERGFLRWSSNVFQIGTEKGSGGGSARNIEFYTDNTFRARFQVEGLVLASNSSNVYFGSPYIGAAESGFGLGLFPFGSGNVLINSGLVRFHGATSSFPALKRSSATLQVRLADDSGDAAFSSGAITTSGTVTANNTSNGFVTSSAPNGASPVRFSANSGDVVIQSANAAGIIEFRGTTGTNPQSLRVFNTFTSSTNFERLNIRWASNECIIDAEAGSGGGTLRGIKIGSATSSLLGFYGATPVDRPATVTDPTGGGTIDTEARTAINDIIDRLQELGLIA